MDKELQTKLQTAVTQKTEANEQKELLAQAVDLGIDLTQFGLNEDGTLIETKPEVKTEVKVEVEKSQEKTEEIEETAEETREKLVASVVDKIKEVFQPKEVKTEDKSQIYG